MPCFRCGCDSFGCLCPMGYYPDVTGDSIGDPESKWPLPDSEANDRYWAARTEQQIVERLAEAERGVPDAEAEVERLRPLFMGAEARVKAARAAVSVARKAMESDRRNPALQDAHSAALQPYLQAYRDEVLWRTRLSTAELNLAGARLQVDDARSELAAHRAALVARG